MGTLPALLGFRILRPTVRVRLGCKTLRLPGMRRQRLCCAWHAHLLRDRCASAFANRRRQGFGAQEASARQAAQFRNNQINPKKSPEGFIYCHPKKGIDLEEEDEDAPTIAPTKPLC
jgi:hypothetical protein